MKEEVERTKEELKRAFKKGMTFKDIEELVLQAAMELSETCI